MKKQDKAAAKQYWIKYLEGYHQLASLPQVIPVKNQAFIAKTLRFQLTETQTSALEQLASNNGVTLNTLLQAIWAMLLSQYNGREDVVFATTVSGRATNINGIERMVGLFINAIPVRVNSQFINTFKELLPAIHQTATESKDYHYYLKMAIQIR